jgi:hypothetical protein
MRKSLFSAPGQAGRWYNSRLAVIVESLVIGFITGFVIVFFRYTLSRADTLRRGIYEALDRKVFVAAAFFAGVVKAQVPGG